MHYIVRRSPGFIYKVAHRGRVKFPRPEYSRAEAQQVVDWLNGWDRELPNMLPAYNDQRYQRYVQARRKSSLDEVVKEA